MEFIEDFKARKFDECLSGAINITKINTYKINNKNNEIIALVVHNKSFRDTVPENTFNKLNIFPIKQNFKSEDFYNVVNKFHFETTGPREMATCIGLNDNQFRWFNGKIYDFNQIEEFSFTYSETNLEIEIHKCSLRLKEKFSVKKSIINCLEKFYQECQIYKISDVDYKLGNEIMDRCKLYNELPDFKLLNDIYQDDDNYLSILNSIENLCNSIIV